MKPLLYARNTLLLAGLGLCSFASAQNQEGKTLRLAVGTDTGPLNPHDYSSNFVALSAVYDPLVRYQNGKIVPALATSWQTAPDGKSLTFKLRQGVKFQDGTPFDAQAVKWNFSRWLGNKRHAWLKMTNNVSSVDILDPQTVRLNLREYSDTTLQELTLSRQVRFLSPKSVNEKGEFVKPIGTGPWQVAEYVKGQRLVLVPFKDYWGKQRPKIQALSFTVIPDPQTRITALLAGQIDVTGGQYLASLPVETVPMLRQQPGIKLITAPGTTTYVLQTNYQKAPWNDERVRRALNLAIDRPTISRTLFQGLDKPARSLLPLNIPYMSLGEPTLYNYNPVRAKKLLAQAGWTPGPDGLLQKNGKTLEATLLTQENVYPQNKLLAEVLQAQLRQIGIKLNISIVSYEAFFPQIVRGDFDLATSLTWGAPYDPYSSVRSMFLPQNGVSARIYTNSDLVKLVNSALDSRTEQQRRERYGAIWKYADLHAVGIPVLYSSRLYAIRSNVENFNLGSTEYELDFSNVALR